MLVFWGLLVWLCPAVYWEEHVDVFFAVAFLRFTLLFKDPYNFIESLYGCLLALQLLWRKGNTSYFIFKALQQLSVVLD